MSKNAIVVVPIYNDLSEKEKISFFQLLSVFKENNICIICPDSLKLDFSEFNFGSNVLFEKFHSSNFASTSSYNKLMLSISFYRRFITYQYILICQLDVFVFENRLDYFIKLNYDYIGAPWLDGWKNWENFNNVICRVGNGGFSLRKVSAFIKLLENRQDELLQLPQNEDYIFSINNSENFSVAPFQVALKFAWETQIDQCFKRNKDIPFACHAWWKYNIKFWRPYIEYYGYIIKDEWIIDGMKDEQEHEQFVERYIENRVYEELFTCNRLIKILNNSAGKMRDFYIWGYGIWGKRILKFLKKQNFRIKGVIDSKCASGQVGFDDVSVFAPEDIVLLKNKKYIFVTSTKFAEEISDNLEHQGLKKFEDYILFTDIISEIKLEILNEV